MATPSKLVARALETAAFDAKALARRMRLSDSALRKYSYGIRRPPPKVLRQLARLLGQQSKELRRVSAALDKGARELQKTWRPWQKWRVNPLNR